MGQVRITVDDYIDGAPGLVGEISGSSVSIDLNAQLVRGDMAKVMAVLQQGLANPERAAFVAHLNQSTS